MRLEFINSVKYEGEYHAPGTVKDIEDKEIVKFLLENNSAKVTERKFSVDPAEVLAKEIKAVSPAMAKKFVENGVDSIDRLAAQDIKDLVGLGCTPKQAKAIYNSFG